MQSALFIGRFQPFHNGHLEMVKKILKENKRIIIVIGSAEKNYTSTNPLTASERYQLIEESLKEAKIPAENYCIIPVQNINNYALWVNHINIYVPPYDKLYTGSKIVKACYKETETKVIQLKRILKLSSTSVRKTMLKGNTWEKMIPPAAVKLLKKWDIPTRLKIIK